MLKEYAAIMEKRIYILEKKIGKGGNPLIKIT
jgi:hypothetical protein